MAVFAALAVALSIIVLAWVFAPLLRWRRGAGFALLLAGVVTTVGLYTLVGTPQALDAARRTTPRTLAEAITRLEQELARDPAQAEGWRLLAEAYRQEGRMAEAATAYARVVEMQPKDPDVLTEAAEARARAHPERRFDERAMELLRAALQMDPTHQRANLLLGVTHRQAGRPAEAARIWEALLPRIDASSATALRRQIDDARGDAGLPPLPDEAPVASGRVTVRVDIDPGLRARLPASSAVFVLARAPGGPPMPVAARRLTLAELPADVVLTDADSPMPTQPLSSLERVEVLARVSTTGQANASAGDLESAPVTADVGTQASIRIDRVRP